MTTPEELEELAGRIERFAGRQYDFQPSVVSVLRCHKPIGLTGHDWDDREAFDQAIALVRLAPNIVTALRAQASIARGEGR